MTTTTMPRRAGAAAAPTLLPRRATPRWWADAVGLAAGMSLVVVTALWVHDRGIQQLFGGGGTSWTALGRITGLWASDLLLIQVLLMARVPAIERAFGQDRLARWHRWTGFSSFHLMLAHIVMITLGYAAAARTGFLAELWSMIVTYPGMLLATAGTAALVMVVVTSLRAARRKLRYESWHLLHLYAYLGVGLALPHQLWTGADFLASPLSTAYWWTLYLVSAGAVLWYRIGVPLWRNARHRLVVDRVVTEARGVTSVYLRGKALHALPARAGQFFQWRFLDGPGWSRAHPYSLSAPPRTDLLRITVKDLGDGSARVATLRPGTRALIEGPYGKLTGEDYDGGPVTMLACGIGITPLLALLHELPYRKGQASLVYRARNEKEAAFRDEITWLERHRGLKVTYLYGPRADRPSWLPRWMAGTGDGPALRRMVPKVARSRVYVCGPEEWTASAASAARSAGVPTGHLHTEQFAW
jgi:predicted ferric reductase